MPRHISDSAVTTFGRRSEGPGELAGAAGCIEDQIGFHLVTVHPDTDGVSLLAANVIDVAGAQRDTRLRLGG